MNDTVAKGRPRPVGVPSHAVPTYISAVLLGAVGLAVLGWRMQPLNRDDVVALVVLCAMGILSESVRESDVGRSRTTLSFTNSETTLPTLASWAGVADGLNHSR